MFEIKVMSYDDAKKCMQSGWPTKIISLIKENMPFWGNGLEVQHLKLQFADVHNITTDELHPSLYHFNRILDFTKDLTDDDRVLVHCIAGISRSTSASIAILIQHGMSYEDAYNQIATQRPQLEPNRLITEYTDDHFNLGGEYYFFVESRIKFPKITGWIKKTNNNVKR